MKYTAFRCPVCGWSNNRDHEGLDECDKCGSENATAYDSFGNELVVKWYRQPEQRKDQPCGQ